MMNQEAARLRATGTRFRSPNGLDDRGYSTARSMAALTRVALRLPTFARTVDTKQYVIPAPTGPPRLVQNRNALLWLYPGAYGVKTGFTFPAGHCLIAAARRGGRRLIVVVLGDVGDSAFDDGASLLNYGFDEFSKVQLLRDHQDLGTLTVGGQPVEALAGATLVRLVRRDRIDQVARSLVPAPGLALPVAAGEVVGRVVVRAHGVVLGSVPALAGAAVAPRPSQRPPLAGFDAEGGAAVLAALLRATFGSFL
jgi:D-alanyl-D-alanine carboxypeptidase (penicillin-binding protein 5/6)